LFLGENWLDWHDLSVLGRWLASNNILSRVSVSILLTNHGTRSHRLGRYSFIRSAYIEMLTTWTTWTWISGDHLDSILRTSWLPLAVRLATVSIIFQCLPISHCMIDVVSRTLGTNHQQACAIWVFRGYFLIIIRILILSRVTQSIQIQPYGIHTDYNFFYLPNAITDLFLPDEQSNPLKSHTEVEFHVDSISKRQPFAYYLTLGYSSDAQRFRTRYTSDYTWIGTRKSGPWRPISSLVHDLVNPSSIFQSLFEKIHRKPLKIENHNNPMYQSVPMYFSSHSLHFKNNKSANLRKFIQKVHKYRKYNP